MWIQVTPPPCSRGPNICCTFPRDERRRLWLCGRAGGERFPIYTHTFALTPLYMGAHLDMWARPRCARTLQARAACSWIRV